jgi:hypothetical protein
MAARFLTPTQRAALQSAATDSRGELHRTPNGYVGDGAPGTFHTSRAVYGLEMLGLLDYVEPGLQSVLRLTEGGRRLVTGESPALETAGRPA